MRKFIRNILLNSTGQFKSISSGVHILNSHYISRENVPAEVFESLLKKLNNYADFITIQEAIACIEKKEPITEKLIAFTFDDGFEECYTKIAPVLHSFNTNAAYFINPGFINGDKAYKEYFLKYVVHINNKPPMTWDMIRELNEAGSIIGNHTMDHVRLSDNTTCDLQTQICDSKKLIELEIKGKCEHFAWTYGKLTDISEEALQLALSNHRYVFSGDNYRKYYSLNNSVLNRRHIEGDWPINHIKYFLSEKSY